MHLDMQGMRSLASKLNTNLSNLTEIQRKIYLSNIIDFSKTHTLKKTLPFRSNSK